MSEAQVLSVIEADYKWPDDQLVVRKSDYDALAAECERLREQHEGAESQAEYQRDRAEHFQAERDAALAELAEEQALRERMAELLSQSAVALRGPEPPLTRYSYADIPSRVKAVVEELAALKGGQVPFAIECGLSNGDGTYSVHIKRYPLPSYLEPHKDHPVRLLYTAPPAQASAWVSVSERLPAETYAYGCHTDDVLCRTRSGKLIIAMLAQTTTGPVWYDQQSQERDVTHWQPLPAAPTPGASDGKGGAN